MPSIPRILHRVVAAETDAEIEGFWEQLVAMHPDWEHRTWRQPHDEDFFELGHLFASCSHGAQIADLVRLEVLWRLGGVYVDSDCEPVRPLDPLLDNDLFIGTVDGALLANGVMGAVPGHAGVRACMDRILGEDRVDLNVPPNEATGPVLATEVLGDRDDITVVPPEFFYPYPFRRPRPASISEVTTPYTYLVHHWAHSWGDGTSTSTTSVARARSVAGQWAQRARTRMADKVAGALATRLPGLENSNGTFLGGDRVLVTRPGRKPLVAFASDRSITPSLIANGVYDPRLYSFIERTVRPGDHVVDVGANIGIFTILMAEQVRRFGRVFAYEPDPEIHGVLSENVQMNWVDKQVTLIRRAASHRDGEVVFSSNRTYRGSSVAGSVDHVARAVSAGYEEQTVQSERLDDRLPRGMPVRFVKVDVEGGEAEVLQGMSGLLEARAVSMIDLEVIRGTAGSRWEPLVKEMRSLVDRHGAQVSLIRPNGHAAPTSLDHVIATAGEHPHVLFTLPGTK